MEDILSAEIEPALQPEHRNVKVARVLGNSAVAIAAIIAGYKMIVFLVTKFS